MDFSIIIPVLNEADGIKACLEPLQVLRHQAEIILVDGGSNDGTPKIAQELVDHILTTPKGRAQQINAGAAIASGKVLLFLHADTQLPIQALSLIQNSLNHARQWGRFDIRLTGNHFMLPIIARFMNWRSQLTGIATGDQAMFVTRELFVASGCFPKLDLMEDIALSRILKRSGPPVCLNAPVISSGRRWEKFGVFKTIILMWSLRLKYFLGADPSYLATLYSRGEFWNLKSG